MRRSRWLLPIAPSKNSRAALAFGLTLLAAAARPARADSAGPSPAPAGPQPAPASSAEAFGDFGGARTKLANEGIVFRGHYVAESAANPFGGTTTGTAYASELMVGTDIDLSQKIPGSALGTFHVTFTEREGSSLSQNALGNILTVQEIYGDGLTPHVTELSYDQPLLGGKFDLAIGHIITENDFADSPKDWDSALYCDYQSNAICGTPIAAPIDSGYVAYPSSAWGARLKANLSKSVYVEGAAYEVNTLIGTRGHGLSLGFGGDTGTYLPVEAGFTLRDGGGASVGDVRFGGYYDTSVAKDPGSGLARFDPAEAAALNALPTQSYRGRSGEWLQIDHLLAGSALPGKTGTAAFAAAQYGDPQTSLISFFADGGILRHGTFAARPNDTLALGYAFANVNPRLRALEASLDQQGFASLPITGQEQIVESAYTLQVVPWLALRPGAQYVIHPSGVAAGKDALVLDLSTTIAF